MSVPKLTKTHLHCNNYKYGGLIGFSYFVFKDRINEQTFFVF